MFTYTLGHEHHQMGAARSIAQHAIQPLPGAHDLQLLKPSPPPPSQQWLCNSLIGNYCLKYEVSRHGSPAAQGAALLASGTLCAPSKPDLAIVHFSLVLLKG